MSAVQQLTDEYHATFVSKNAKYYTIIKPTNDPIDREVLLSTKIDEEKYEKLLIDAPHNNIAKIMVNTALRLKHIVFNQETGLVLEIYSSPSWVSTMREYIYFGRKDDIHKRVIDDSKHLYEYVSSEPNLLTYFTMLTDTNNIERAYRILFTMKLDTNLIEKCDSDHLFKKVGEIVVARSLATRIYPTPNDTTLMYNMCLINPEFDPQIFA